MSYMEMSDARSMKDDVKFDADVKFGDKRTSRRFIMCIGDQNVNDTDEVADWAFMKSGALVPVNQDVSGRCKWGRKILIYSLMKMRFFVLVEGSYNQMSKLDTYI